MKRIKILKCFPFKLIDSVRLVEGFDFCDGVLGDEPGTSHRGIDYARMDEKGNFISFEVFSTHDGYVFQGKSEKRKNGSWGNFVKVYKEVGNYRFETIYAHLKDIPKEFPLLSKESESKNKGMVISEGGYLGKAGISGDTKGNIQLHFELQIKNLKTNQRRRVCPYGVHDRCSSGKYPQPGEPLRRRKHYWTSNKPPFADEV